MSILPTRFICIGLLCAAAATRAQMAVQADPSSGDLFKSRNSGVSAADGVAVHADSRPAPYWGIGTWGEGGYIGVKGSAELPGTGARYGGYFYASGGTSSNYGVYAYASGTGALAGYFGGDVYISGQINPSDPRIKRDIQNLPGALSKVMALQPATYYFDDSRIKVPGLPKGRQFGLLSDEVKAVLPELVKEVPVPSEDKTAAPVTIETVNYTGLIPILIGAMKEQQAQIAALQAALAAKK